MDTEAFIKEILNRPPIWMSKHPHHKYKNVIKRLWEEIKQLFPDHDIEKLKKKWKNIKDGYRKELKKIPAPRSGDPGPDDEPVVHGKYFSLLSFLREEYRPAEGDSNLNEYENEPLDVSSQSDTQSVASVPPRVTPPPHEASPQPSTSHSETPRPSRKRSNAEIRSEYLEIEKKKLKILEQEVAKQSNSDNIEKTEDYFFLMSILPQMQKLTPFQKIRLRNRINQALMDEMSMDMCRESVLPTNIVSRIKRLLKVPSSKNTLSSLTF